ncbi:short-chain dehydrogenase, partial [Xanthomonas oryzae pv. oryzae]
MSSVQALPQTAALAGRVVLITGAAGGLGAAAAQ